MAGVTWWRDFVVDVEVFGADVVCTSTCALEILVTPWDGARESAITVR